MSDKKYRVAVCLSGLFRNWDLCRASFRYWETVYHDISFEYFISTWDKTQYIYLKNDKVEREFSVVTSEHFINDFDPKQLKSFKIESDETNQSIQGSMALNTKRYTHKIMSTNLLKSAYELKNNFKYDLVISTRPDIMIKADSLYQMYELFLEGRDRKREFVDSLEVVIDRQVAPCDSNSISYDFRAGDILVYGRSSTMDIYSGLYRYVYMNEDYNMKREPHGVLPYYMRYAGLWGAYWPRSRTRKIYIPIVPRVNLRYMKEQLNDGEYVNKNWDMIQDIGYNNPIKNKYEHPHTG